MLRTVDVEAVTLGGIAFLSAGPPTPTQARATAPPPAEMIGDAVAREMKEIAAADVL
jgi:hypothetical protein